jgi:hypothetical protein
MSDESHVDKSEAATLDDGPNHQNVVEPDGPRQLQNLVTAALRKFYSSSKSGTALGKRDLKEDRTKSLLLLIGGIVGAALLFIGLFSTPPAPVDKRERVQARQNLGRREEVTTTRFRSPTPLLNAQVQPDEYGEGRVNAEDVTNTSRRDIDADSRQNQLELAGDHGRRTSCTMEEAFAYRPPAKMMTSSVGIRQPGAELVRAELNSLYSDGAVGSNLQTLSTVTTAVTPKSSIVFIRAAVATSGEGIPPSEHSLNVTNPPLFPPGSRLIARLDSAVTSALKAPVVAAIEYNYERDGMILVPAGTKAIGELEQVSISGFVGISFHMLQMPDGRTEKIEALAMDLLNAPLKGKVTGANKGRKFMTRTLSGVGTIAAYVVGAGGSGVGQPISGETLLRDRLAGNIASAGEQELSNASVSQNITVTLPAQTRLYIVFQKAAGEPTANASGPAAVRRIGAELPTIQELRELMDLKREINRMYEASGTAMNPAKP